MSIPTPKYSHMSSRDFELVYEPAEDSFLLLDAIELELETLKLLNPTLCVEIGPGSGIISAGVGSVFKSSCFVLACDINPKVRRFSHNLFVIQMAQNCSIIEWFCYETIYAG